MVGTLPRLMSSMTPRRGKSGQSRISQQGTSRPPSGP